MMDNHDARRITVIEQTIAGKFNNREASELLDLSVRQIKRLKKKAKGGGESALLHGNRGKRPHNALLLEQQAEIIALARTTLKDHNYLHMQEVLEDEHGIQISYSALSRLLKRNSIATPMTKKRRKKHRSRKSKEYFGELVQIDASRFDWFGDGSYAHLHAAIDDATNQVLGLYFTKEESHEGYCELIYQMNETQGLPHCLYADGRTIFFYDSKAKKKLTLEEELAGVEERMPQFARACKATGISLKRAYSPQAKGLVERLWGSLQNRLPKDFQRLGIEQMDQANLYLQKFIKVWNRRHSHAASKEESYFKPSLAENRLKIHFAPQEARVLSKGYTFSYQGKKYMISDQTCSAKPGDGLIVASSKYIPLVVLFEGEVYQTVEFVKTTPPARPKLTAEELSQKRSEYGRMGRRASPFG